MASMGLTPTNSSTATHFTETNSTLLDLIFVRDTSKIPLCDQFQLHVFSKHDLVFPAYDFLVERDLKKLNHNILNENVLQIN